MEVLSIIFGCIMLVSGSIELFVNEISCDRSPSTVRSYRGRLNLLDQAFGDRDMSAVTTEDLQAWFVSQRTFADGRSKAPDTIRLTIISFELWQVWLVKRKHIPQPWLEKQKKPGGRKREYVPNDEETRLLFTKCKPDFIAAYRAMRLTGARPGELSSAKIEDIDKRDWLIVLQDHKTKKKTGKPRKIAIGHPALVDLIKEAIGDRTSGPIFLRASGRPWTTEALSAAYRKARNEAGLSRELVCYSSRHEHATKLYKATRDIKGVADALGHTNISMTMRYAHADAEMLRKNQLNFTEGLT